MQKAKEIFDRYFSRWQITLFPETLECREKGTIVKSGWRISFIFGIEDNIEYLEYYAIHRMTNDRHIKIYETGEIEILETLNPPLEYNPPANEKERKHNELNKKIEVELRKKGLL